MLPSARLQSERPSSTDAGLQFFVRRKPACRLLGIGEPAIDRDVEHAAAGFPQGDLGLGCFFEQTVPRGTRAWLVTSHSAVFDLDLH
jgi:hypothetical protein